MRLEDAGLRRVMGPMFTPEWPRPSVLSDSSAYNQRRGTMGATNTSDLSKPRFTCGNSYFGAKVHTWNLPSGYSCPGALECLTWADPETGKLRHGKHQVFRCYSATSERYPAVRKVSWDNLRAVKGKTATEVAAVLEAALPASAKTVRIHAGGDFFSQAYFDGWLAFCRNHLEVVFWAFTKSVNFWVTRLDRIPQNLTLQASYGGRHDHLISEYNLKYARVVYSVQEATDLGLEIDTDDRLAMYPGPSFALLEKAAVRKLSRNQPEAGC